MGRRRGASDATLEGASSGAVSRVVDGCADAGRYPPPLLPPLHEYLRRRERRGPRTRAILSRKPRRHERVATKGKEHQGPVVLGARVLCGYSSGCTVAPGTARTSPNLRTGNDSRGSRSGGGPAPRRAHPFAEAAAAMWFVGATGANVQALRRIRGKRSSCSRTRPRIGERRQGQRGAVLMRGLTIAGLGEAGRLEEFVTTASRRGEPKVMARRSAAVITAQDVAA